MPDIRSSAELRNHYNEVSDFCHSYNEPVFITKNGKGDLAVMSIEAYEQLMGKYQLYSLIQDGIEDVKAGRVHDAGKAISEIMERRKK